MQNAECKLKNAKYKVEMEKTNFDFKTFIIAICQI